MADLSKHAVLFVDIIMNINPQLKMGNTDG